MNDLEKVIKGLKCCELIHRGGLLEESCNLCPYQQNKNQTCEAYELFFDARQHLKEQEPRALTFEEIDSLANKREETVVYLERRWDTNIYGAIAGHCNGVLPNLSCIGTMRNVIQQYNQTWRCWSSRPTDEQREATPWNT